MDRGKFVEDVRKRLPLILALLFALVGALCLWNSRRAGSPVQALTYTDLLARSATDEIVRVEVAGDQLGVTLRDGTKGTALVPRGEPQQAIVSALSDRRIAVEFVAERAPLERLAAPVVPIVILALLGGVGYVWHKKRRLSHVRVGSAQGRVNRVSFADVAGVDEAKDALSETIEFLRDPTLFGRLGGRAPKGILLSGPPGTGKTLLARAAAAEAEVPFLSASGSGFQEVFAGVGAARVRRLFEEARRVAPCVVFIDEIDALGKKRGRGDDSASADADQMLNQLLIEMDGFDASAGIVVLASTNRHDVLDSALLRPGRFDRHITMSLPDVRGRTMILQVHARRLIVAKELDWLSVARSTTGFSGADLARLLNEAAIFAAREHADAVDLDHVERAKDRVTMGEERRGMLLDEGERHATAVHEAGHVAVGLFAPNGDTVQKVSILPRGRALGVTLSVPDRDRLMYRREYLEDRIAMLLGGRAAEQAILGTMTAGASDDIERAVELARHMVAELGMSPLGPIRLPKDLSQRSPLLLDRVERATTRLVRAQLARASAIVEQQRTGIDRLVEGLLERDTLLGPEIRACFAEDREG